jgi:cysteine desulfurase
MNASSAPSHEYVYLDHAATSPLRPEARDAMQPYGDVMFANPSGSHRFAREARKAIDEARDLVASVIACKPGEIVFTSGGTEGANTAILGAVRRNGGRAVCSATEHHAVLHCVEHVDGVVVPVTANGPLDPAVLRQVLADTDNVSVVSVMAVNNETGAINDIEHISHAVRGRAENAILHTDAVQAACWLDLRDIWKHVDILTLSAHKFGGPKGMGIMVVREGVHVEPLILGGGQERDRRSGTHNVAGIVGTATALHITDKHRATEVARLGALRDQLINDITSRIPQAVATLKPGAGVAGTAHICLEGLESESILYLLDGANVCVSAASACASGAMEPSHVLEAMGVSRERIKGSLRFSLGHTTTKNDIDAAVNATVAAAERLAAVKK